MLLCIVLYSWETVWQCDTVLDWPVICGVWSAVWWELLAGGVSLTDWGRSWQCQAPSTPSLSHLTCVSCSALSTKWSRHKGGVKNSQPTVFDANNWSLTSLSFEFQPSKRPGRSRNFNVKSPSFQPQFYRNTNQIYNGMTDCGMYIYMFSYLYSYNNKRTRFIWNLT